MIVTFVSVIDSLSEDGVVRFVDKPGGYAVPQSPEDIAGLIKQRFHAGRPVEISYDDSTLEIVDARPGD